jgi:hypothetical protein
MTIPAGSTGTVNAGSSWTRLYFKADACPHCGVKAHCGGLSKHDLEPVLPLVDADSTEAHQTG